ncbi:galactose-1-phosphate uridylyltransferase [Halalkalibacter hemicellulosilyticusJCM 9152]|uniref:Galactose-1-phosphate uridylyltransferase n=2 Tax=Halalkalibacter TaxID=2893056 RepID=W4QEF4_9BACI|nr:galactose-1-phosphate uridylyltransferase [Halalkalibacter hemicellulosilyticusJCM 9152]
MSIYQDIERLIQYGLKKKLIEKEDVIWTRNQLLAILSLDTVEEVKVDEEELDTPVAILTNILDWAAKEGVLESNSVVYRDLLDTQLMGMLTKRPSEVIHTFFEKCKEESSEAATRYLYQLSKDVHYIRTDRIAKNEHWYADTGYGQLEVTINLSKPEKDPKAIAAAKGMESVNYPKCLLCVENVGYKGRINHPARQNLRTIPVTLNDESWHIQFSPYVYYNEHAIVLKEKHEPMKISHLTFKRLLDFVEQFPHYFLGSNADLPIVGGSILSHDHFQGGAHDFPMAKAEMEEVFSFERFPSVQAGIVKWPMSVLRLQSTDKEELANAADDILEAWRVYEDRKANVVAQTDDTPHNTITPISRMRGGKFELDLVLRNNRTTAEHPDGLFHPHQHVHHIKKENIGLIEVMGLAVLPGRLKDELKRVATYIGAKERRETVDATGEITKHLKWAEKIKNQYGFDNEVSFEQLLRQELGQVFLEILHHAGVFKRDESGRSAFVRFVSTLGTRRVHY